MLTNLVQTFQLRDLLHARKLIAPHAARAQLPHLPTLDQIMQRLHRLPRSARYHQTDGSAASPGLHPRP